MPKSIFLSRSFYLQLAGIAALATQTAAGEQLVPAEYQVSALLAANLVMRAVTSQGVVVPGVGKTINLVRRFAAAYRAFRSPLPPKTP